MRLLITVLALIVSSTLAVNCSDVGYSSNAGRVVSDESNIGNDESNPTQLENATNDPVQINDPQVVSTEGVVATDISPGGTFPGDGAGMISTDEVINNCLTGPTQTKVVDIHFPANTGNCPFGVGDNNNKDNNEFSARKEQTAPLGLPQNVIICDMTFEFPEQRHSHDDHFLIMLDRNILVSSYNMARTDLNKVNDFYQYDWSKIRGDSYYNWLYEGTYCANGGASCSFPSQQSVGRINVEINATLIQKAMANSGYGDHAINFVTIGDGDNSDCTHDPVDMKLTVKYRN